MTKWNKRVAYAYDDSIGSFDYGKTHPMKPHRIRMTTELLMSFDLQEHIHIYQPKKATEKEMTMFHYDDYVRFLEKISAPNAICDQYEMECYGIGNDSPRFLGLYEYCQISAGGSISGAQLLNDKEVDIAINWAGGLHHARTNETSGFCYINDIVLSILTLLKTHKRVLYIDIDIHHGDGVEEAFYTTDRVMTVSFHKTGTFFPCTGFLEDIGHGKGKGYSINVPLKDGMDDQTYERLFKSVVFKVNEVYRPDVIVLQSGADSLSGDRLGSFNLSTLGHSSCLKYLKTLNLPLQVLGGGGYTIRNVPRCWAYETAVAADVDIDTELRPTEYSPHFWPETSLIVPSKTMENQNTEEYIESLINEVHKNLMTISHAPSVEMPTMTEGFYQKRDFDSALVNLATNLGIKDNNEQSNKPE
eukprot:GHVP01068537.1.p1 GENE.GHVP01068537.1~~GHVP01068537.1.p1  ORF type:complete len:416 (-),score=67.32 GHVP01068537.1:19-1266(-)